MEKQYKMEKIVTVITDVILDDCKHCEVIRRISFQTEVVLKFATFYFDY